MATIYKLDEEEPRSPCSTEDLAGRQLPIETPIDKSRSERSNDQVGYDCKLIEVSTKIEVQSECPICLQILREPFQVTCCGYSFCKTCIERVKEDDKPCPTCNEAEFTVFHNKGLQRSLNDLHVRCPNDECEWTGELRHLDHHLNPEPEKIAEGCQYVQIKCMYECGEELSRKLIPTHEANDCPKRPYSCDYCREYTSTFEDVTSNHYHKCKCYPLSCPNRCDEIWKYAIERQNLDQHLKDECPLATIDCEFSHAGCKVQLPRKDMLEHIKESQITHISLLATQLATYRQENELLQREIAQLKVKQNSMEETNRARMAPVDIFVPGFSTYAKGQKWYSRPFYSHPSGYKMQLSVIANDVNAKGEPAVSASVHLMAGEFDDNLQWPFKGCVNLQVRNHPKSGFITILSVCSHDILFSDEAPREYTDRVAIVDYRNKGFRLFLIRHCRLSYSPFEAEYVMNDYLHLHVIVNLL